MAYVCFIVDAYYRMIVGWRVASHMRTAMVLDAIEMARWSRGNTLPGLRMSLRYRVAIHLDPLRGTARRDRRGTLHRHRRGGLRQRFGRDCERLLQVRADLRTRTNRPVEDRRGRRTGHPRVGVWQNTNRLHGYLDDIPPAEFEATFYDAQRSDQPLVEIQ